MTQPVNTIARNRQFGDRGDSWLYRWGPHKLLILKAGDRGDRGDRIFPLYNSITQHDHQKNNALCVKEKKESPRSPRSPNSYYI